MKRIKKDETLNLTKILENSESFYATLYLLIERFAYENKKNPIMVANEILGNFILSGKMVR